MKKLSKEKKNKLVLVVMVTLLVIAGLWYGVLSAQRNKINNLGQRISAAESKLEKMKRIVAEADRIESDLKSTSARLKEIEDGMATGDHFAWFLRYLNNFKVGYQVSIPQLGQPAIGELPLLPGFPYKQVAFTVVGTAFYHDLGDFIRDFENQSPYVRIENLEFSPATSERGSVSEKLTFKMNIVFLIKPNTA